MKDQVDSLKSLGIRAEFINSSLTSEQQQARLSALQNDKYDLIYVAPERFRSPRFQEILRNLHVQLMAVDEAHCISEWGHDFRHDYARLGNYRKQIRSPQMIALTATATPVVQKDIAVQLDLQQHKTFVAGFARPNLCYSVQNVNNRIVQCKRAPS